MPKHNEIAKYVTISLLAVLVGSVVFIAVRVASSCHRTVSANAVLAPAGKQPLSPDAATDMLPAGCAGGAGGGPPPVDHSADMANPVPLSGGPAGPATGGLDDTLAPSTSGGPGAINPTKLREAMTADRAIQSARGVTWASQAGWHMLDCVDKHVDLMTDETRNKGGPVTAQSFIQ